MVVDALQSSNREKPLEKNWKNFDIGLYFILTSMIIHLKETNYEVLFF